MRLPRSAGTALPEETAQLQAEWEAESSSLRSLPSARHVTEVMSSPLAGALVCGLSGGLG